MNRRSSIWLADYLRAVRALKPDEDTAREIAAILQMDAPAGDSRATQERGPGPDSLVRPAEPLHERPEFRAFSPEPPNTRPVARPVAKQSAAMATIPARLVELAPVAGAATPFLDAAMLPADPPTAITPEPIPLFPSGQTRAILSRTLARRANTGAWDVPRAVQTAARGELLTHIPRLSEPTLAGGVQLLIDRASALAMFRADQQWLQREIERVVGSSKIAVLEFIACPRAVYHGDSDAPEFYLERHLPPPGTVVAAITDLGIGRPSGRERRSGPDEWLEIADRLRKRRCPFLAFVPYAPERWPDRLRRAFTIVQWDWVTTAASINSLVGKGLAVVG